MKEELQGKLVEILTSIQTAAGKASDFAMEQLPDIAQSYVVYGRVHASLLMLVLVSMLAASLFCTIRFGFGAKDVDRYGDWTGGRIVAAMGGGFVALFALGVTLANLGGFVLVWFAPKVWLLKELASLVK